MFMTAWVFEARHCPTLLNEIKITKLDSNAEPQAGINILLAVVGHYSSLHLSPYFCLSKLIGANSSHLLRHQVCIKNFPLLCYKSARHPIEKHLLDFNDFFSGRTLSLSCNNCIDGNHISFTYY